MYEGTIQYVDVNPQNGMDVTKKEQFIMEHCESFTDAEEQLYDYASGLTAVDVVAIKRSKIREVVNERKDEDDSIWLVELQTIFLTDEGEQRELKYKVLVFAKTFDNAKAFMSEYVKQGYSMDIVSIKKTKLKDVLI